MVDSNSVRGLVDVRPPALGPLNPRKRIPTGFWSRDLHRPICHKITLTQPPTHQDRPACATTNRVASRHARAYNFVTVCIADLPGAGGKRSNRCACALWVHLLYRSLA